MKYFFDNDFKKYRIKELRDGLTIEIIKEKFPWILQANIKNTILGTNSDNTKLIFYDDELETEYSISIFGIEQ